MTRTFLKHNLVSMTDLNRRPLDLLQSSDGLLVPDVSFIDAISKKQYEFNVWDEKIVLQGLMTMKELLQKLANQDRTSLVTASDEMEWCFRKTYQKQA